MGQFDYQRTVIAYHGCDKSTADDVLFHGKQLRPSENDYDWLGRGIYFWEHGPQRAFEWTQNKLKSKGRLKDAAVIGAVINLGNCFDLLDTHNTALLAESHEFLHEMHNLIDDTPMPKNQSPEGKDSPDYALRYLDCAVINWAVNMREDEMKRTINTVRGVFQEGEPAFPGSKIMSKSHIQIAVRTPEAILGYFKPAIDFAAL